MMHFKMLQFNAFRRIHVLNESTRQLEQDATLLVGWPGALTFEAVTGIEQETDGFPLAPLT